MKTLIALTLILGLNIFAVAQQGLLSGTIYDASGAVVPQAKVAARGEKGELFVTETDEAGVYTLSLPHAKFDAAGRSAQGKISKYEIIVDVEARGFKGKSIRDFAFVPTGTGKMFLDIALEALDPEPCGYGGDGCLRQSPISPEAKKPSNKVTPKPLEKLPKTKIIKRNNK